MITATSLPRIYVDERGLRHKELTERLIGIFFDIAGEKQLLNYLRAAVEMGLHFNFGPQAQFSRCAFENARKNPRNPRESAEKKLPGSCR